VQKQKFIKSTKHQKFVSEHWCIVCMRLNLVHAGRTVSQAAHIRMNQQAGMGRKPCDTKIVPLCSKCHTLQHNIGEREFWKMTFDPFKVAQTLAERSPDKKIRDKANGITLA